MDDPPTPQLWGFGQQEDNSPHPHMQEDNIDVPHMAVNANLALVESPQAAPTFIILTNYSSMPDTAILINLPLCALLPIFFTSMGHPHKYSGLVQFNSKQLLTTESKQ
jgi:hypothetical protein